MIHSLETTHAHHPHHLECPRCGRHTVVLHGESRYVCLSCGWSRDVSDEWNVPILPLLFLVGIFLALLLAFVR